MLSLIEFLNQTPVPEPQALDYISASRLNLWLRCPLAFKRRYIDGIQSPPAPSLSIGKVVHDVLDGVYRCAMLGAYATANDIPAFVDDAWNRVLKSKPFTFESVDQETKSKNQIVDIVKMYLAETDIADEKPVAVEQKFQTPLIDPLTDEDFGITLVGIADLILDGEDGPVIVDFKTAASASSNCELQHEIQLTAYSYLVREVLGIDESALEIRQLVKTKTPKLVVHRYAPRTDEHFERFFGIVKEYLDSIDRGIFNCRPSWNCGMCEFSFSCGSLSTPIANFRESKQCTVSTTGVVT